MNGKILDNDSDSNNTLELELPWQQVGPEDQPVICTGTDPSVVFLFRPALALDSGEFSIADIPYQNYHLPISAFPINLISTGDQYATGSLGFSVSTYASLSGVPKVALAQAILAGATIHFSIAAGDSGVYGATIPVRFKQVNCA
ncbi:MAG: hypothetical protein OXU20_00825 [Myxococcales bacterium]|nr:hypothetical protein [Myxococcales bacterium]MDD9970152.1 hypothetical protein [Myxococcales bacterium]